MINSNLAAPRNGTSRAPSPTSCSPRSAAAKSLRSMLYFTLCLQFTLVCFANSSLLTPHSSLLIPHSSFLTPDSSFLIPHSSLKLPIVINSNLAAPRNGTSRAPSPTKLNLQQFLSMGESCSPLQIFGQVSAAAKSLRSVLYFTLCLQFTLVCFANSSLLTPHSSLLTPNSSFLIPHSTFLIPHS